MAINGIRELRRYIRNTSKAVEIAAEGARNTAISTANGLIKTRVFTQGKGDSEGKLLKAYQSESYVKKREKKGLRTDRKDLEFSGTLRNSIKPIYKKDRTNLEITKIEYKNGANTQEVAVYQAKAQGAKILRLTTGELKETLNAFDFQFSKQFKKVMNVN